MCFLSALRAALYSPTGIRQHGLPSSGLVSESPLLLVVLCSNDQSRIIRTEDNKHRRWINEATEIQEPGQKKENQDVGVNLASRYDTHKTGLFI